AGALSSTLKGGDVRGFVNLKVRFDTSHSRHAPDGRQQVAQLASEDWPAESDVPVADLHGDGVRVRHHAAEARAHAGADDLVSCGLVTEAHSRACFVKEAAAPIHQ